MKLTCNNNRRPLAPLVLVAAALGLQAGTNEVATLEFREPHAQTYLLLPAASAGSTNALRLASAAKGRWRLAQPEGTTNTVEIGDRLVLQLEAGVELASVVSDQSLVLSRTLSSNLFILQTPSPEAAIEAAQGLSVQTGVVASYPVMRRLARLQDAYSPAPNDPLFSSQWHLDRRGVDGNQAGPDLNVRAAWPDTRGSGVLVAVADCGFQLDHPELVTRALGSPHYNFYQDTSNGAPPYSSANHATAVAGLIAAERNNSRGVSGVAPEVQLASWVVFGSSSTGSEVVASDEQLMDMFQYASNRVAVQNHSWGSATTVQTALDVLSDTGIGNAVKLGRDGRGVIIVRAGGNNRTLLANVNDDGYAQDPRAIAVAAMRTDGRACSYSDPGACLLVAAPSGDVLDTNSDGTPDAADPTAPDVWTTDRTGSDGYNTATGDQGDYTGFNGTSASAPQVAGIAALILGANPTLGYRDVQQILLHSARHYDLADPDVRTNGAGFRFSHNLGFGVPDAGFAVQLAKTWPSRPASTRLSVTSTTSQAIPDDALRVLCTGTDVPTALSSIHCLPSLGPHADAATATLPLVDVGQANEELTVDLHGKVALIQRGVSYFSDKIARAARAGAAFAIIYNNTGTTVIQALGGTTYVPIPAVAIGQSDGLALREFLSAHPETTASLQLTPCVYRLAMATPVICEHVGVRLKTTHTSRSDVRVTLVSPMGSRSVLQAINTDTSRGPRDWTYWSAQHFYESSVGEWRVEVSDERSTTVQTSPFSAVPATGSVTYVQLLIDGVPITDTDHDGLDDDWERLHFGTLVYGPMDDPDGDGFNNAREQAMGTDPLVVNSPFKLDFALWQSGSWRLSWPALESVTYTVYSSDNLGASAQVVINLSGRFPLTEYVATPARPDAFFWVRRNPTP